MLSHRTSRQDRAFVQAFEADGIDAPVFDHEAHLRLAYVCLVEGDVETALLRVRLGLKRFLAFHRIDAHTFHETLTGAWLLAVWRCMGKGSSRSFAEFIAAHPELLDTGVMLTHYSAGLLYSDQARLAFVAPDLEPLPPLPPLPSPGGAAAPVAIGG